MQRIKDKLLKLLKNHVFLLNSLAYYYNFFRLYGRFYYAAIRMAVGRSLRAMRACRLPEELQLPITYRCNCDCVMCGIKQAGHAEEFSPAQLERILSDGLFANIRSVGVNGGEPFLLKNLAEYVAVLLDKLPALRAVYIITNASCGSHMLQAVRQIKALCAGKGVRLHLSISVDGVGERHDDLRRRNGLFRILEDTCAQLLDDLPCYCDSFGAICTLTKANIEYTSEVESWAQSKSIPIYYNVATIHERLQNADRFEDFSVLTDQKAKALTIEFFYGKFRETQSRMYFALYYCLRYGKRISRCTYQDKGITILPNGSMAYCATHSKTIGCAYDEAPMAIYKANLAYRGELIANLCDSCSHYTGTLTNAGEKAYIKEMLLCKFNPVSFL